MSKILFLIAIVVAAATSLVFAGNVKVTKCGSSNGVCSNSDLACANQVYQSDTCISRSLISDVGPVVFRCTNSQSQNSFCVNATGYGEDSSCSTPVNSLSTVCTTCSGFGNNDRVQYDCGGLPTAMFVLTNCDSGCDNCTTTITPFRTCKRLPGVGFTQIHGEANCGTVEVLQYSSGSDCSGTPVSTQNVWNGACFNGVKITCN